jgi:hypothetical protein
VRENADRALVPRPAERVLSIDACGKIASMTVSVRHQCMIYDGPPSRMLPALVATIREHLAADRRCMYINSPAMVAGLRSSLYAAGTDVQHEVARGALVLDSETSHLIDGRFDVDRMIAALEAAIHAALADGFVGLFATGDMSWEFGPEKEFSKLLHYEWSLEQLFRKHPALMGICQYHRDLLPPNAVREGLVSHGNVFINATISRLNPHYVMGLAPEQRRVAAQPALEAALALLLSS